MSSPSFTADRKIWPELCPCTVENMNWNSLSASYSRSGLCAMPLRCLSPILSPMSSCMQQSTVFYRRVRECFQQCCPNSRMHGLDCLACHEVERFSSVVLILVSMGLIASHVTVLWRRLACTSMDGYGIRLGVAFLGWIRLQFYSNR